MIDRAFRIFRTSGQCPYFAANAPFRDIQGDFCVLNIANARAFMPKSGRGFDALDIEKFISGMRAY